MIYKVLKIEEDLDYGCEERLEGAPVMAVVTLEDENGNQIKNKCSDNYLYANHIEEGNFVTMDEDWNMENVVTD